MRKPLSGTNFLTLLLLSVIIAISGCTKTPTNPNSITVPSVVTFNVISSLTSTTAQSGGVVTNGNNGDILGNGVCWSTTNQLPTINDSKTTDTINVNGFTSRITGLTAGTTYYLRAYGTNSGGAGYGKVIKFTTPTTAQSLTSTVTTIAGGGTFGYNDGIGTAALFSGPQALAYNPVVGNIYIIDAYNNLVRTMTTGGTVSTLTNPTLGFINGPLSTALFYGPRGMAIDASGNTYIGDLGNDVIRKITAAGVVSTFAGNGTQGYIDGATTVAEFRNPQGVAVDASGNVYVADQGNNIIRKITTAGVTSIFAGYPPQVGGNPIAGYVDTIGTLSLFNSPSALVVDASGNVYVADQGNRAIRMITPAGVVTTLAGSPVQKNIVGAPVALALDAAGDLFIADESGRVLEITAAHILYTLAGGLNATGYVNGAGTAALFSDPQGITVDAAGNIYVSDFNNNVIRKIVAKFQ